MRLVWFRGKWHAYERVDGRAKRTSLGTTSREVAARRLIDLDQALRRKPATVAERYEDYFADRGSRLRSQETLRLAWKRLLPVFGHLRPDQVSRATTRAYAAKERRRGVGDGSIRRDLGVLGAIVRHNEDPSPAIIELPAAPPSRSRHLTREEYRALLEAAKAAPHFHLFVVLSYKTAGRREAILQLPWHGGVDFQHGLIHLDRGEERRKGRATVPMTDDLREMLLEAQRAALTDYVIEYGGRSIKSVKRAFRGALDRAKLSTDLSDVRNLLRHTAAVHMAEDGVSMAEISQYLGHTNMNITERVYARFSPDYLRRAAGALE